MAEPFLGEIRMFAGNFAPRGWALCNGQILPISQNTALFSLLGTTYGGDGIRTFALPNLQSRLPMHWGQGPGLSQRAIGEIAGTETVTLINSQMPIHNHAAIASNTAGDQLSPSGNVWAEPADTQGNTSNAFAALSAGNAVTLAPQAIGNSGGSQPVPIMPPFLCVTYIIALEGIFPSRN